MDKLLDNNLAAKLLSVILAVILWLQVSGDVPQTQRSIRGVPVTVRNIPSNLAVATIEPDTITVFVRGKGRRFASLSREDFEAQVELGGAKAGRFSYVVERVLVPRGVTLVDYSPAEVIVVLQPIVEREFPVQVRLHGTPQSGYRTGTVKVVPERVTVRGPEQALSQVASVVVDVSINGATTLLETSRAVQVLDSGGRPVGGVTVAPEKVSVAVPVSASTVTRTVPVRALVIGQPAAGKVVLGVTTDIQSVTVEGTEQSLIGVNEILTEAVKVDNANETLTQVVPLHTPPGVRIISGRDRVEVTVEIGRKEG